MMHSVRRFFLTILSVCILFSVSAQDTIHWINPSLEGPSNIRRLQILLLDGWFDCGKKFFPDESPPDLFPTPDSAWGVYKPAIDGKTYLGLVTRYSNSYEAVSQLLEHPLDSSKCYSFTVYLSISEVYESQTPRTKSYLKNVDGRFYTMTELENFSHPVELLIWGGHDNCHKKQLLALSGAINNHDWKKYKFEFSPDERYSFLTLEAYYVQGTDSAYNGHILIDGLSPIVEVKCREKD